MTTFLFIVALLFAIYIAYIINKFSYTRSHEDLDDKVIQNPPELGFSFNKGLVQDNLRIIEESRTIINNSKNIETIAGRFDLIIQQFQNILAYNPPSSFLVQAYDENFSVINCSVEESIKRWKTTKYIILAGHIERDLNKTIDELSLLSTANAKITRLNKCLIKARKYLKDDSCSFNEFPILKLILLVKIEDLKEKAKKYEFKNQILKSIDSYLDILFEIEKVEKPDDEILEAKKNAESDILKLGGKLPEKIINKPFTASISFSNNTSE